VPTNMQQGQKSSAAAEQLGRSRGGLTTKIHARIDGAGLLFTLLLTATIPRKSNQRMGRPHNAERYKQRNHIERFFGRIKHFRAVATRYDKRASNYLATVMLAAISLTPVICRHTLAHPQNIPR
jgi:hypothetical protein